MRGQALALSALVLITSCTLGGQTNPTSTSRQTITLASADDPARAALLWAIANKKVSSPFLDIALSFLPVAQIVPAARAKQFDVIEATALIAPRTFGAEPGLLILSGGLIDRAGTVLVTGRGSAIATPTDLRGKTIAVASLEDMSVEETRYVLAKKYGMNVDLLAGDVKFVEVAPDAVPQLLRNRTLDAAVLTQLARYQLKDSPEIRVLSEVATEVQLLTGLPAVHSVFYTYQDRAQSRAKALGEIQRLLSESREYLRAHQTPILNMVAKEQKVDAAYLNWFFTAFDFTVGPVSEANAVQIAATWEAARSLGAALTVPRVYDVLFKPADR